MVPAVHWILSWQGSRPRQQLSHGLWKCLCFLMRDAVILSAWHLFIDWGCAHWPWYCPNQRRPFAFLMKTRLWSDLTQRSPSLFEMVRCLLCSSIPENANYSTSWLPFNHQPSSDAAAQSWVSFGTSGYLFMAPISLTHVQVQYWLAPSPDSISI